MGKQNRKGLGVKIILIVFLVISLGLNVFQFVRLKQSNVPLFEGSTVSLTKDNYDKYLHINIQKDLQGTYGHVGDLPGLFYDELEYRCTVQGNSNIKFEDTVVTVKIIIKAKGYTKSAEATEQVIEKEFTYHILEKGNTEDVLHEEIQFDNMRVSNDGLFVDYEIVDISGTATKK